MIGNIQLLEDVYGYIYGEDKKEYYFHKDSLKNCTIRQLDEGDTVEFEPSVGVNGKPRAITVRKKYQAAVSASIANPGINPNVDLNPFNDDERRIIHFLGKIFYVTRAASDFSVGQSSYGYCLIKPTEFFVRTFQFVRELVVIFSDYATFEPRSLDAASEVYKRTDSKLRLDRGCHVFICHDDDVENKLSTLLKDSNVDQTVIPFTYRELLSESATEDFVRNRFRKYLFDHDLFAEVAEIKNDIFFFGRRDYVHDIVSKCKHNVHSGVFGLRRSGKTSLLLAVKRLLDNQSYPTVFIPCQSELLGLDWRTALCRLVLDVYDAFGQDTANIHESDYRSPDTTTFFAEDMNACLKNASLPVTIMFDEIEAITFGVTRGEGTDSPWLDGKSYYYFWNTIRGYCSKFPQQLSILVAGTNPRINEEPIIERLNKPNPMHGQLSESNQGAYLPAFSTNDTANMVNTLGGYMGLAFDEYSVGKLTSDCGGHPYLMRLLCSAINNYVRNEGIKRPLTITKAIYDNALPDFERDNSTVGFFWMVLNILITGYPKEFNTLKVLALEGDALISQVQKDSDLGHLIGYGLVEHNQGRYAIKYDVITRFLRGEYRFERQGLNIEEQKEEIQLRINNAEMRLRKLVKNSLLINYGTNRAKQAVLDAMNYNPAITPADTAAASQMDYAELFDASTNKMYFSLLKTIIENNLSAFSNIFDLPSMQPQQDVAVRSVSRKLSAINRARRCPDHSYEENAKNWSWDNFVDFRESMSWLESILNNFE